MDLKSEKEAFVTGLEGTTIAEIYLITVTLLAGYLLRCCCLICVEPLYRAASSSILSSFGLEYLTIIAPAVLIFTVLADYSLYVLIAELALCVFLIASKLATISKSSSSTSLSQALSSAFPPRHPYLTVTRTFVNLFTAVAILGVDFQVYPRRLGKAELYGSGLMDIGVGAFLMAHGVTSPEARELHPSTTSSVKDLRKRSIGGVASTLKLIAVTVRQILPLFCLGFLRLVSVKSTGYQEHVTEYGVHWNFFFTIATVRVLCAILSPLLNCIQYGYGLVSVVVAILYQVSLQRYGLESYVLLGPDGNGSRVGLLSANREGVVSCVGYLAIYTGWVQVGKWLFKPRRTVLDFLWLLPALVGMFGLLWLATSSSQLYVQPISRRLVNLPYILWIFSYGFLVLSVTLVIDLLVLFLTALSHVPRPPPYGPSIQSKGSSPQQQVLCVATSVDYNQLAFFLLANVLTGLVNLSMDTLHAGGGVALTVLLGYMAVLVAVFMTLHAVRIKIKL